MARISWCICLLTFLAYSISKNEAAAPLFLQAITSALATIPFSGGPLSTGLVGAKLAIGTKLLYYLGFFGRRAKPKAVPKPGMGAGLPGSMQAVPLPYFLSGAGRFPQMGGGGFGGQNMPFQQDPFGGVDQAQIFQALRAQGFDADTAMQIMNGMDESQGGGFGNMPQGGGFGNMQQGQFGAGGGFGNMQQGQFGAGGGFGNMQQGQFGTGGGFGNMQQGGGFGNVQQGGGFGNVQQGGGFSNVPQGGGFGNMPQGGGLRPDGFPNPGNEPQGGGFVNIPQEEFLEGDLEGESDSSNQEKGGGGASEDVESFFTFLRDMDENTCISRLVCDIGDNPSFLGDFSENIHSMVRTLDVQPSSGAYPYIAIMETGRKEAGCRERFPECTDTAYEIVKNIAPTVGVPDNINIDDVNKL